MRLWLGKNSLWYAVSERPRHPLVSGGSPARELLKALIHRHAVRSRVTGRYYEEFTVGETIEHSRRRTISEADNQRFCDMTMNQQPLHLDAEFAETTTFGERVVNGLYTLSLAVGMTIPETTDGTIVANLSYDDVEHPEPVFHGDTIAAESTVTSKRETSDGERGIVTMQVEVRAVNRDEQPVVCTFERTVLSQKQSSSS